MAKQSRQLMIPTIAFPAPHWELVFQQRLRLSSAAGNASGEERLYAVKTRKDGNFSYRGLVFCYTSQKNHNGPMFSNGFESDKILRGVVGCANIMDVTWLTEKDKRILFAGYNNAFGADQEELAALYKNPRTIYPMDYGYFMDPVHSFDKPIDLDTKYMFGSIGRVPLVPQAARQLPDWAREEVEKLRRAQAK